LEVSVRRVLTWVPFVVLLGEISTYLVLTGSAAGDKVVGARNDLPLGTIIAVASVVMCATGCVIVSKQPRNAIGWLFALIPLGFWVKGCSDGIVYYAHFARHDAVPGGHVAAWMSNWDYFPPIATLGVFVPLFFPNGRLPSRRWRPVAFAAGIVILNALIAFAFASGPLDSFRDIRNPFGLTGTLGSIVKYEGAGLVLLPVVFLLSASSLVFRARSGSATLRAQVKWLTFAFAFFALGFAFALFANFGIFGGILVFVPVCAVPIASAIAITRYRLFEIDRLVSRTLSYAIVTGVLVGVFALLVFLPTAVIGSEGRAPSWLIAVATLTAALLARPVQRRVQTIVDHRFNRARYDSTRTIEDFAARLRDEIDIDTLRTELCDVVARSMQPASVSLWLRPS
jgi:hypothetical protein